MKLKINKHNEACDQFQMTLPTFSGLSELQDDMSNVTASWTMYKEYSEELNNMGQQDWITFRSKLFDVEDFVKKCILP